MYVVGLTGGIGSGKSEAARLFAELGVPIVDVDIISHELTASGQGTLEEITQVFGKDMLNSDGSLNRAALRQKVFADREARKKLETILHPAIYNKAMEALNKNATAPYQVLAIPLLFESDRYLKIINRSLVIDSSPEMQISRASKRDGLSESDIQKIIDIQIPREKRNALADDIILNDGLIEELKEKIKRVHEKYINTCVIDNSNP
ncbi:dephospho-CoA kinase [Candidatus Methylopumilus turicensis]|uniref:Dephospho-CoA kinase n=1 Tax=Candidatus Methylopumilus turicensis TaxID=1581680 RepID=A0A0B7IW35_9PROT|nr:dephospho-CoA kinase [Candidatus Methylopumilus turicensis]CEN56532.1 dephospho-CoA kinase [Candidatus Methylopumilus turicensis]